tara:strand:- start:991 stop:1146 length:156 start_codon:yes stop_codon:yes gene_type:complete
MKRNKEKINIEYICEKCGSSDVEEQQWVKVNIGELTGSVGDSSVIWCCQCE